jgi:hypothetical protein
MAMAPRLAFVLGTCVSRLATRSMSCANPSFHSGLNGDNGTFRSLADGIGGIGGRGASRLPLSLDFHSSRAQSQATDAVLSSGPSCSSSAMAAPKSSPGLIAHALRVSGANVSYRISLEKRAGSWAASIAATGAPSEAPSSVAWSRLVASAAARAPASRRSTSVRFLAPPTVPSNSITACASWPASWRANAS